MGNTNLHLWKGLGEEATKALATRGYKYDRSSMCLHPFRQT